MKKLFLYLAIFLMSGVCSARQLTPVDTSQHVTTTNRLILSTKDTSLTFYLGAKWDSIKLALAGDTVKMKDFLTKYRAAILLANADTLNVHKAGTQTVTGKKTFSNIAALTTSAESWIGPSATAGLYFKGGYRGFGTTNPGGPLEVKGKTTTWGAAATMALNGTYDPGSGGYPGIVFLSNGTVQGIIRSPGSDGFQFLCGPSFIQSVFISPDGNVSIKHNVTPTSKIHIGAGTATAGTAPLGFTSGALLTVPVAGKVEFLTDKWYGTITTGAVRKTFAFLESPTFTGTVEIPLLKYPKSGYGIYKALISDASGNITYSRALGTAAYKDSTYFQTALTNPVTGSGTAGRIPFYTGSTVLSSDAGLVWDNTNKRLGVNVTPTTDLDVAGKIKTTNFQMTNGAAVNYILKSDANGNASWVSNASGSIYNGAWDASTNSPTLANGTGTTGSYYHCTVSGTVDFGAGNISFTAYEDDVAYNGAIWQKIPQAQYALLTMTSSVLGGAKLGGSLQINSDVLNVGNGNKGEITVSGSGANTGNIWTINHFTPDSLYAKLTDKTGTGLPVFNNTPTFITPILGTPTSGNFSTGTFTWPIFNQTTTGTSAGLTSAYIDWNSSSGGNSILNKPNISLYRLISDTTANSGTATIFDLQSYVVKNDSSKLYERIANKVTSISGASTDVQYPSAKVIWDNFQAKDDSLKTHATLTTTAHGGIVASNATITGATKTKITYDTKGLVTGGADATTYDIAPTGNRGYITPSDSIQLDNLADSLLARYTKVQSDAKFSLIAHNQAQSTITALVDSLLARYTKTQADGRFAPLSHTQAQSTITSLSDSLLARYTKIQANALLSGKVDKESGKHLPDNNYTDADSIKVAGLPNLSVQSLSGTTPTLNAVNGVSGTLTISGNTTLTLSNLTAGWSGNIRITNPSTAYIITLSGYTNKIAPPIYTSTNTITCSGGSKTDVLSWWYDGTYLNWAGTKDLK